MINDRKSIVVEGKGVDTHAHVFTQQLNLIRAGEGYVPDYDASLRTYVDKLRAHGLTHSVLIQPSFLGTDNSYLLRALQENPTGFRGIVIADPSTSFQEIDRMKQQGVVGTRLIFFGPEKPDPESQVWVRFLENVAKIDWIVEVYSPASLLPSVTKILLDLGCRLLIDHYGRPNPKLGLEDPGFQHLLTIGESGRVWVDISGPYRNGEGSLGEELSVVYLSVLRESFGLERILWGSDWPCVQFEPWNNFESSCAFLAKVLPNPEDRQTVLWHSAANLFGFTSTSVD